MLTEQLPDLLDYVKNLPGFVCLVGDENIHFDIPFQSQTKETLTTLSLNNLVQVINLPTHRCGHIIDCVIARPNDNIHKKSTVTVSLESDHYCTKSYFNVSVSKPSTLYRTDRNITNIDRPSFIAELRANIVSEHVTSTLVTGKTAASFSSFENVSQLTVKECILSSAPKSCELDPIPSKLLVECLDSILPYLTDLYSSSLASGIFPQCFKSALVTHILKKKCLDRNDLNNYRPVSNLCFIAKILEKLVLSQVSS